MKNKLLIGTLALTILFGGMSAHAATIDSAKIAQVKSRVDTVYGRMDNVMTRFHDLMAKASANGHDITDAQTVWDAASAKRATLQADVATLDSMLSTSTTVTPELRAQVQKVKTELMDLKHDVMTIRDHIKASIAAYKASHPTPTPTTTQ